MKHRMGNSPHCNECFWYKEKKDHDGCKLDGWCHNKKQCSTGINGHRLEHPHERIETRWNNCCRQWEDAEDHLTHFEVCTRTPEPWKSEAEQARIRSLLNGGDNCDN